jgi:serine/threonine protein kinase
MRPSSARVGGGIKLDILIGAGTFGSVYLARPLTQQAKQKEIAVRLLNPMALSLTKLNKIEREVESARTELSHTNLARLLEVVYNGKAQPGILMEVRDAHAHAS